MLAWVIEPGEKAYLLELGMARMAYKDPSRSRRRGKVFTDLELYVLGLLGEYAVSRALGQYLENPSDYQKILGAGGDGGVDFRWHDGRPVAVKYTHRWKGRVYVETRPGDTAEELVDLPKDSILISTHGRCIKGVCACKNSVKNGKCMVVCVAGWIGEEEFRRIAKEGNWGYGDRLYIDNKQLHKMEDLT